MEYVFGSIAIGSLCITLFLIYKLWKKSRASKDTRPPESKSRAKAGKRPDSTSFGSNGEYKDKGHDITLDIPLPEFSGRRYRMANMINQIADLMSAEFQSVQDPPPREIVESAYTNIMLALAIIECFVRATEIQLKNKDDYQ